MNITRTVERCVGHSWASLLLLIFTASSAAAQQGAAQPEASLPAVLFRMLPLFFIVFFIFYFLVIRPQDKKMQEQAALVKELKKGDQVVTSAGIIARVAGVEKDYILLEISGGARMKVESAHVTKRFEPSQSKTEKKKQSKSAA